jgi:CRP/FNR family transcriptional regulator
MVGMAVTIRRLTAQLQNTTALNVSGRVAQKLLELADRHGEPAERGVRIRLKLTQEELAQMVGVTRVCVNRHLHRLVARHILSADRDGITLLQPQKLRERVG